MSADQLMQAIDAYATAVEEATAAKWDWQASTKEADDAEAARDAARLVVLDLVQQLPQ